MSDTFARVRDLVASDLFRLSFHGEEEMIEDKILLNDLLLSVAAAIVVEDYPDAFKGPSVLLLQEFEGRRFHAIWGLSKVEPNIATLITAYLPNPNKWHADFKTRLKL